MPQDLGKVKTYYVNNRNDNCGRPHKSNPSVVWNGPSFSGVGYTNFTQVARLLYRILWRDLHSRLFARSMQLSIAPNEE
jgi:hypothetical protein